MHKVYLSKIAPAKLQECRAAIALYAKNAVYTGFDDRGVYLEVPDSACIEIAGYYFDPNAERKA